MIELGAIDRQANGRLVALFVIEGGLPHAVGIDPADDAEQAISDALMTAGIEPTDEATSQILKAASEWTPEQIAGVETRKAERTAASAAEQQSADADEQAQAEREQRARKAQLLELLKDPDIRAALKAR